MRLRVTAQLPVVVLASATSTNAFVSNNRWSPHATRRSNTETTPQQPIIIDARGYKETAHGIAIYQRKEILLAGIRSSGGEQESSGDGESTDKMLDELVRVKLEKDHKRSFLKSRPWKLPYEDARRWVQANLGADTDELVRVKLEKDHKRSFLKSRPWKLPYEDARRWVQANLGADTQEDFFDLVENGNLRTPYIPKNPEDYYSATNNWISWDHFLHGLFDTDSGREPPSGVKPSSGIFD
eukprot:CAMPEP_0178585922 /NCGR_PEP_ID=MMETSP0697-20121206/25649_1 /TAXON_ID=265572 /ORGANISM="Extubocellulus spinifer, Strain CCMP396" /LENGTH=239 /DNA_ID=CAMNT_0020222019 /DNA_START=483 /DNA_END=1202 /DNA_ORIENTATION=-